MMFLKEKLNSKSIRELVLYGIFGVATTLVNIIIYQVFLKCNLDYRVSNLIALIGTKLFAYVVNKNFVFHSKCENFRELCEEFFKFAVTRGLTGLIDYFGLIFAVEILGFSKVYSKYVIQFIVIALNYIFGKEAVFKRGNK